MFPKKTLPSNATKLLSLLKNRSEDNWIQRGETQAFKLFKQMAQRVPAYKNFLKKNGVKPQQVRSIHDFKKIPLTNKENYLLAYPLESLCWD